MKCQECGKVLGDNPFIVTVGLLNTDAQFQQNIQVPVCDEECARKYMFRVKDILLMAKLVVGEGR